MSGFHVGRKIRGCQFLLTLYLALPAGLLPIRTCFEMDPVNRAAKMLIDPQRFVVKAADVSFADVFINSKRSGRRRIDVERLRRNFR